MAAVTTYATLSTRINDELNRSYAQGVLDGFIADAEAEFRLYFGPSFAKETTNAALAFTSGSATLPTGFIRAISMVHTTYGELDEVSVSRIRELRINAPTTPSYFCITAATIITDALYTGNLTLDYEGTLTGLSSGNTTNWLVTNAPIAYTHMCLAYAKLYEEDFDGYALRSLKARQFLEDLGIQAIVAQKSRATVTIPGTTP